MTESREALLMRIGFDAAELRRIVMHNRGCFNEREQYRLMRIRLDLQSVAEMGCQISEYVRHPDEVEEAA